jgi:hypothetical protein
MLFFTRYHIFVLEWITAAQMITLIAAAAAAAYILWRMRAREV